MSTSIHSITAIAVNGSVAAEREELVAVEEPLEIRVGSGANGIRVAKTISITMRTPGHDSELAAGFLFTEGIITDVTQIAKIAEDGANSILVELADDVSFDLAGLDRHFYTSSSCGVCGKTSLESLRAKLPFPRPALSPIIAPCLITTLPDLLREAQSVFDKTGGLHASALFTSAGETVETREDVGRHNALDKLVGHFLLSGELPLRGHVLLVSGRASFELVQKAGMAGIPVMAAVGAPSSLAVELARELGMTLIGFLRGNRFNVYSGEERIRIHE